MQQHVATDAVHSGHAGGHEGGHHWEVSWAPMAISFGTLLLGAADFCVRDGLQNAAGSHCFRWPWNTIGSCPASPVGFMRAPRGYRPPLPTFRRWASASSSSVKSSSFLVFSCRTG